MSTNPLINAIAVLAYILLIVSVMSFGTQNLPKQDTIMAPIAMVSLFTLSAAVMGYLFCYEPIQLYFEGKKKLAVQLFLQTVVVFGCITAIILALLFTGVFAA